MNTLIGGMDRFVQSSDGNLLIVAQAEAIHVFDIKLGTWIQHFNLNSVLPRKGNYKIASLALSPDGQYAVTSIHNKKEIIGEEKEGIVIVWDLIRNKSRKLMAHSARLDVVAFLPDGKQFVTGSHDCTLKIWELATLQCRCTLIGHKREIVTIAVVPDGSYMVSGSYKEIKIWDPTTGMCIRDLEGQTGLLTTIAISPDGRFAFSGSSEGVLRIWEIRTGLYLKAYSEHSNDLNVITFTSDHQYVITGSSDKTIKVWKIVNAPNIVNIKPEHDSIE